MGGMSMGCYMVCQQRQVLNQSQRLQLKQLQLAQTNLRHGDLPNAVKGLEGMQVAHRILQKRASAGILIGGLAESVWNQRRKPEELYAHKDVDVLVLDENIGLEDFEGGVDWWIPQTGKITLSSDLSRAEGIKQTWYANVNGVVLNFGVRKRQVLLPGLYLPNYRWVAEMREKEVAAQFDSGRLSREVDGEVVDKFRERIEAKMGKRLPQYIQEAFKGYVFSSSYSPIELEGFNLETIRGIKRFN